MDVDACFLFCLFYRNLLSSQTRTILKFSLILWSRTFSTSVTLGSVSWSPSATTGTVRFPLGALIHSLTWRVWKFDVPTNTRWIRYMYWDAMCCDAVVSVCRPPPPRPVCEQQWIFGFDQQRTTQPKLNRLESSFLFHFECNVDSCLPGWDLYTSKSLRIIPKLVLFLFGTFAIKVSSYAWKTRNPPEWRDGSVKAKRFLRSVIRSSGFVCLTTPNFLPQNGRRTSSKSRGWCWSEDQTTESSLPGSPGEFVTRTHEVWF